MFAWCCKATGNMQQSGSGQFTSLKMLLKWLHRNGLSCLQFDRFGAVFHLHT
uniref:Uncharacterized protein n=1 Tax=Arundo donax TaxID=35708 RepID=A0A0A9BN73_ARUDO